MDRIEKEYRKFVNDPFLVLLSHHEHELYKRWWFGQCYRCQTWYYTSHGDITGTFGQAAGHLTIMVFWGNQQESPCISRKTAQPHNHLPEPCSRRLMITWTPHLEPAASFHAQTTPGHGQPGQYITTQTYLLFLANKRLWPIFVPGSYHG